MSAHLSRRSAWVSCLLVGALLVAVACAYFAGTRGSGLLLSESDDAMRMVTATDLLHGQSWTDTVEHRDNAPSGASMHWSRLVDAPLALLMAISAPLVGPDAADLAAIVWPLSLLGGLLALTWQLTRRLVPSADLLPTLVLALLTLVVLIEFLPGRVDHHSVQMLLTLGLVLSLIDGGPGWRSGLVSGLIAATSLAIGVETLPFVLLAVLVQALFWALEPERKRPAVLVFACSLPAATFAHLLLAAGPHGFLAPACDALSSTYLVACALSGLALAAAVALGRVAATPASRIVLAGSLQLLAAGVTLLLFPQCLRGPYAAIPPDIAATYFLRIGEAKPLWVRLADSPIFALGVSLVPILALPITLRQVFVTRGALRLRWGVLAGFLAVAVLVMLVQIRGARIAAPLAIPAGVLLIGEARQLYQRAPRGRNAAMLLGSWLLFASLLQVQALDWISTSLRPALQSLVGPAAAAAPQRQRSSPVLPCLSPSLYPELAALPPGLVVAPAGMAPYVLRYTGHSLVSAGYHRNTQGLRDQRLFLHGPEAAAQALARSRGIDYVVLCRTLDDPEAEAGDDPSSLAMQLARGERWSWLVPMSSPDAVLQIFRVEPAATEKAVP